MICRKYVILKNMVVHHALGIFQVTLRENIGETWDAPGFDGGKAREVADKGIAEDANNREMGVSSGK